MAADGDQELRAQLDRIATFEAGIRPNVVNRALQWLGPKKPFIAVYRRIGPKLDPWLTKVTGGDINKLYGFPACVLTTTGARSGRPRPSPLFYVRDGDTFAVVGTNFGTEKHPAWTGNLLATPRAELTVGPETIAVEAELADDAAFARIWPKLAAVYPGYDTYLERLEGTRTPRLFILTPVSG
ncbi:MAG: nitroreductase family deazaflavin-dependent oxidoreductase [Acidimicrobiales bacterium]|nr:nitroreductase family deazaflavin-dependent oxidoreductase [Acidimicrobiales bacterium]